MEDDGGRLGYGGWSHLHHEAVAAGYSSVASYVARNGIATPEGDKISYADLNKHETETALAIGSVCTVNGLT